MKQTCFLKHKQKINKIKNMGIPSYFKKINFIMMKTLIIFLITTIMLSGCNNLNINKSERQFKKFLTQFESKYKNLEKEANFAAYKASVSGNEDDYKKSADLSLQIAKLFQDSISFLKLKNWKNLGLIKDELLTRQLDLLYNHFLEYQGNKDTIQKIILKSNELEQKFSTYRAVVDGNYVSDNYIDSILKNSTNSEELKKVWLASKQIGKEVAADVIQLVKLKNSVAKELGFSNYYEMTLKLNEQDPSELEAFFNELDSLTSKTFVQLKAEIDDYLSKRLKISKNALMPWHYQNRFFQEGIEIGNVNLDKYYNDKDIVKVSADFYRGIDLPVDSILKNSDLFEKAGKNQHAFCMDMDRSGDVRILANVRNDAYWMNTMLHELGHGVYDKYKDFSLPYFLRQPAHTFTTEAVAIFFGSLASNPQWIQDNIGISESEKENIAKIINKNLQIEKLVFSRWCQVVFRFEKAMFENPDQDLNILWWNMVEKYQLLKRPENRNEPDWASKIHIALYQAYYHNYLLGDVLASQINNYINTNILNQQEKSISNNKRVGEYFVKNIFYPAAKYNWNTMIEKATGEKLTSKYFAAQFINN